MPNSRILTDTFNRFFESEKSGAILLVIATIISVGLTNSVFGSAYLTLWQSEFLGLTLEHWINDGLMAIFFLMIGLELERELYVGELSILRNALLPIFAAIGGTMLPALIHYSFNAELPTQAGIGIPMATDIAFALGALALLGSRIPPALKVFVVAFAVIDDLIAIIMIAIFYTDNVALQYLAGSLMVFVTLLCLNRFFRVASITVYLLGGALMWLLMLKSGVHATAAGVMLAFAIPFWSSSEQTPSPSHKVENFLHKPVAFIVLPLFALANTGIFFGANWLLDLTSPNSMGVIIGLVVGKPLGVALLSALAVMLGICTLPVDVRWRHLIGSGMLGGIGFTISIFITNLAFGEQADLVNASKIAVFTASLMAGFIGFVWLRWFGKPLDKTD
ncbi:MAG: Na+/H+ antiporter NhaA [Oxalobacteraceae bacterium]|jgi:NhaA family Na+:H+ antiporter|nr:Na+/H+ antiporter NhaA [Oxalobacteraceae bacterium]